MVNIKNGPRVFKYVYCDLPQSKGVIKLTIGTNIKVPSREQIRFNQL